MLSPLPPPAQGQVDGAAGRIPCRPPPSRNTPRDAEYGHGRREDPKFDGCRSLSPALS